jgi:hypothetical protein
VQAQMGTWKQNGAVMALATNTSQAIKLAGMGIWEQWGLVNISLTQCASKLVCCCTLGTHQLTIHVASRSVCHSGPTLHLVANEFPLNYHCH